MFYILESGQATERSYKDVWLNFVIFRPLGPGHIQKGDLGSDIAYSEHSLDKDIIS